MSGIAICTDSSALFPAGVAERLGVTVVPIRITLDSRLFEERDHAIDAFYARLTEGVQVTTSQPSPGDFLESYTGAAATGAEEVLSIHLDARISGTAGGAALAAREAPIPVTVVDTKTVSFGVGVCVRAAAEAIAVGASARDAAAAAGRVAATQAMTARVFEDGGPLCVGVGPEGFQKCRGSASFTGSRFGCTGTRAHTHGRISTPVTRVKPRRSISQAS